MAASIAPPRAAGRLPILHDSEKDYSTAPFPWMGASKDTRLTLMLLRGSSFILTTCKSGTNALRRREEHGMRGLRDDVAGL